jgi:hypothetical protein
MVGADESCDLLDLALAEIGRRPDLAQRRNDGVLHIEVDRTSKSARLIETRGNAARERGFCRRAPIAWPLSQVGANDQDPSCGLAPG